jgi:hypothetical protein
MTNIDRPRPIGRAVAGFAVAAAIAATSLFIALPVGAVPPLLELTLSKTTAVSNGDHGDQIQVSGTGCTPAVGNLINVLLYKGAFGPADVPPINDLEGAGYSPASSGDWSGSFPIPGGGALALTPGQYTIRAGCFPADSGTAAFWYANAVITVTDGSVTTTVPPDTSVATTTQPGRPATTAAAPASQAAVAARPAYTG